MEKTFVVLSAVLFATSVLAAEPRAGLWEMKIVKAILDGQDASAQMAALQEKTREMLAKLPPDQRRQAEAMMKDQGAALGGAGSAMKMCITPEQAQRKTLMLDPDGRCQPGKTETSGDTTRFDFDCTAADGSHMKGKGEMTATATKITSRVDMTKTDRSGTHTMQQESEMAFLGADCRGVAPVGSPGRTPRRTE